jgi:hypothetical protein
MLAEKLGTTRLSEFLVAPSDAGVEFQNVFAPVANLTASNVDVKINVEGDVAVKFAYMTERWELDFGYNYWGRSCEKLSRRSCGTDPLAGGNTWALKGDAFVVGFTATAPYPDDTDGCVRLAATESLATINSGTNGFDGRFDITSTSATTPSTNPGIDAPVFAVANPGPVLDLATTTGLPIRTSVDPVFLSDASVDLAGVKGSSNKFFVNWTYEWIDCGCTTPFLGVGGEIELASRQCNDCSTGCSSTCVTGNVTPTGITNNCQSSCASSCNTGCNSCSRCALSQWGLWIKGGIAFN